MGSSSLTNPCFELRILETGNETHYQVGWVISGQESSLPINSQNGTQGVGYGSYSVTYNTARAGMVFQGSFQAIPNCTTQEGSVIRCGNRGESWYIDGKLVASTLQRDNVIRLSSVGSPLLPCFSIKGESTSL